MKFLTMFLSLTISASAFAGSRNTSFFWGQALDGNGHCYQAIRVGKEWRFKGSPVPDFICAAKYKPIFEFNNSVGGGVYCYARTPEGYALNDGSPVPDELCN